MGYPLMLSTIQHETAEALDDERFRQRQKFGHEPLATDSEAVAIMGEEFGEICRAVCQALSSEEKRKEVLQLAAVCIAYLDGDLHFGNAK